MNGIGSRHRSLIGGLPRPLVRRKAKPSVFAGIAGEETAVSAGAGVSIAVDAGCCSATPTGVGESAGVSAVLPRAKFPVQPTWPARQRLLLPLRRTTSAQGIGKNCSSVVRDLRNAAI